MKVPKINLFPKKYKPADAVSKGTTVGNNMFADLNAEVIAQGTVVKTETVTLQTKINELNALRAAELAKEGEVNDQRDIVVQAMNDGGGIVSRVYRISFAIWRGFGFILSKTPTPKHVPVQPTGCKAVEGAVKGTAKLTRNTDAGSWCRVYESIGIPTDFSTYYPANPDLMKTSTLIVKPKKLLVPTTYILIPVNGKGDGDPSAPFGDTFV